MLTVAAASVVWGAAAGVLLPRAAYRLSVEPERAVRAACPAGHPITGPVRGWLGSVRCPSCDAASGDSRYAPSLVTPLLTALVSGALAAATGPRPELAVWLLLTPIAILLALVDRAVHRLPDPLTLPLAGATVVLLGVAAPLPGADGSWPTALLGGLALAACYFALFLVNPNGLGLGDVKLALALGAALGWYGWPVLFAGAFAGFLLGSLYGLGLMLLRGASRKAMIPFGPFMITGALLGVLLGGLSAG